MEEIHQKIISTYDGLPLEMTILKPDCLLKVKGIFQICHGMAEHQKRYLSFMQFLVKSGYICVIHDHRGHGDSIKFAEDLGYFYDTTGKAIIEDAYQVTKYMKEHYPNLPIYLFGHSMGSMVVRNYIKSYDDEINKLIVCGPPCENKAAGIGVILAKWIMKVKGTHYRSPILQHLALSGYERSFKEESINSWIVSQKEVVKEYDVDEKCGFVFTTNGFLNLFLLMKNTYSKQNWKRNNLNLPILFIAGEEDPVIGNSFKFQKAQDFLKQIGYKNVRGKLYVGKRHEILNEDIKQQVYEDILHFIENP